MLSGVLGQTPRKGYIFSVWAQAHWEHEDDDNAYRARLLLAGYGEHRAMISGSPTDMLREMLRDLASTTAEAEGLSGQLERATITLALAQTAFRAEVAVTRLEWVTEETVALMAAL